MAKRRTKPKMLRLGGDKSKALLAMALAWIKVGDDVRWKCESEAQTMLDMMRRTK